MARASKETVEQRPFEIIKACQKLYETKTFQEITIKDISTETSISRPSIYNYFETKEEIFLALLNDEYKQWNDALEEILQNHEKQSEEEFAAALAKSIAERECLLKIQCMNLYEIEEHSRQDRLTDFKVSYRKAMDICNQCLQKFFPQKTEEERGHFMYSFFPFMYGIYPYVYPTAKQLIAMKEAGLQVRKTTIYDITYQCVRSLLRG